MSISGHPSLGTLAPQLHTSYQRDTPSPGLQELPWHPILLQCPCPAGTDQRFGGAVSGCSFPVPFPELIQQPTQSSPMQVTFAICGMLGSLLNPARGILSCNVFTLDLAKKKKKKKEQKLGRIPCSLRHCSLPAHQQHSSVVCTLQEVLQCGVLLGLVSYQGLHHYSYLCIS